MKIGLFFGSFNPVHVGHMVIANYFLEYTDLDRIWFVVTPHNPLKSKPSLLDSRKRLHLVDLAIGDNTKMKASDIEFKLPQPNYTINTLTYLKEKYPSKNFCLIIGADNLSSFHKWKNYEEILRDYEIYVYPRKENETLPQLIGTVHIINAPVIELSSTAIRNGIKEKKDLQYMVPSEAWKYIKEMNFYK
jgi:nicotinate-nucleotide adenylyltransferase